MHSGKKILEYLQSDTVVRYGILAAIYSQNDHHAIKSQHDRRVKNVYRFMVDSKIQPNDESINKLASLQEWDWRGIPKFHWVFVLWEVFTNFYYVYIIIKNFYLRYLERYSITSNANCYLLGKFHATSIVVVDEILAIGLALIMIAWRLIRRSASQTMTMPYVLCFTKRDLNEYNYSYIRDMSGRRVSFHHSRSETSSPLKDGLIDSFFHDNLSYRVQVGDFVYRYNLKPNRTRSAISEFRKTFTNVFLYITMGLIIVELILFLWIFDQSIEKEHYENNFPKCGVEIYWIRKGRPLLDINWYRLLILLFDMIENLSIWLVLGPSVFFGVQLVMMSHNDLIVYWQKLHKRVVQCHISLRDDYYKSIWSLSKVKNDSTSDPVVVTAYLYHKRQDELDYEMHELQCQIHDFFEQIKRTDRYISDTLSFIIFIWFSILLIYIYLSINGQAYSFRGFMHHGARIEETSPFNLVIILLPMIMTFIVGWHLLNLHQRCLVTYCHLCPIIARYQSKKKLSFLSVMDYFINRRTCYTIFRINPFLPTTYLSIMGYTFSCFFMLRSLFENRSGGCVCFHD